MRQNQNSRKAQIRASKFNAIVESPVNLNQFVNVTETQRIHNQSPLKITNISLQDIKNYVFEEKISFLMIDQSIIIQKYYRYKFKLLKLYNLTEKLALYLLNMKKSAFQYIKTVSKLKQLSQLFLVYRTWQVYKESYSLQKRINYMNKLALRYYLGNYIRSMKKSYVHQCNQYTKANSYCNIILFKRRYLTFNFMRYYTYVFVKISQCSSIKQLELSLQPPFELEYATQLVQNYYLNKIYCMYNFENTINLITLKYSVFNIWINSKLVKQFQNKMRTIHIHRYARGPFDDWKDQATGRYSILKYRWMFWRFRVSKKKASKKEFYAVKFSQYYQKFFYFTRLKEYVLSSNILNTVQCGIALTNTTITTFLLSTLNDICTGDSIVKTLTHYERKSYTGQIYTDIVPERHLIKFDSYFREYQLKYKFLVNLKEIVYKRNIFQRLYLASQAYIKQIGVKMCFQAWHMSVQESKHKLPISELKNIKYYLNHDFWVATNFIYASASFGNRFEQLSNFLKFNQSQLFYNKYIKIIYSANSSQLKNLYENQFKNNKNNGDNMLGILLLIKQFVYVKQQQEIQNSDMVVIVESKQFKDEQDETFIQRMESIRNFIPTVSIPTLFYFLKNYLTPKLFQYRKPFFANYYKMTNSRKRIIANIRQYLSQLKFFNNNFRYIPRENLIIPYLSQFITLFWLKQDIFNHIESQFKQNIFNSSLLLRLSFYQDEKVIDNFKMLNFIFPRPSSFNQRKFAKQFDYEVPQNLINLNQDDTLLVSKMVRSQNIELNQEQFNLLRIKYIMFRPSYILDSQQEFMSSLNFVLKNYIFKKDSLIDQKYKRYINAELSIRPNIITQILQFPPEISLYCNTQTIFTATKQFLQSLHKSERQVVVQELQKQNDQVVYQNGNTQDKAKLKKRINQMQQRIRNQQQNLNLLSVIKDADLADELIQSVMIAKEIIDPNLQIILESPIVWKVNAVQKEKQQMNNKKVPLKNNQKQQMVVSQIKQKEPNQNQQQSEFIYQETSRQNQSLKNKTQKQQKTKIKIKRQQNPIIQQVNKNGDYEFDFSQLNDRINQNIISTQNQISNPNNSLDVPQQEIQDAKIYNSSLSLDKLNININTININNKLKQININTDDVKLQLANRLEPDEQKYNLVREKLKIAKKNGKFKNILSKLTKDVKILNQIHAYEKTAESQVMLDSLNEIIKLLDISDNQDTKSVFQQLELLILDITQFNPKQFDDKLVNYQDLNAQQKAQYLLYQVVCKKENLSQEITENCSELVKNRIAKFLEQFQQEDLIKAIQLSMQNNSKVKKSIVSMLSNSSTFAELKDNSSKQLISRNDVNSRLKQITNNTSSKLQVQTDNESGTDDLDGVQTSILKAGYITSQKDYTNMLESEQLSISQSEQILETQLDQPKHIQEQLVIKQKLKQIKNLEQKVKVPERPNNIIGLITRHSFIIQNGQKIGVVNLTFDINRKGGIFQYLHNNYLPQRKLIQQYLSTNKNSALQQFFFSILALGKDEISHIRTLIQQEETIRKQKQQQMNQIFSIHITTFTNDELDLDMKVDQQISQFNSYIHPKIQLDKQIKPKIKPQNTHQTLPQSAPRPQTQVQNRKIIRAGSPCVMYRKYEKDEGIPSNFVLQPSNQKFSIQKHELKRFTK